MATPSKHNIILVFGDQWRAQAFGFAGDVNARTPNIDRFAAQSRNMRQAVAQCPVCGPSRGTLWTGQTPLTHGIFVNDVPLRPTAPTFAETFAEAGYDTAYIGKWHIDGHGRNAPIPPERRLGFNFWRGAECSHNYLNSTYVQDDGARAAWPGYDADSQTDEAIRYLAAHTREKPFALALSWGPPHDPYHAVPERFLEQFPPESLTLRPNVPPELAEAARQDLSGYYAHGAALDECFGRLLACLDETQLASETIVVFFSDHGDMIKSHAAQSHKQLPWDESVRVPLLIRVPRGGSATGVSDCLTSLIDLYPTCLGLCGIAVPAGIDGADMSAAVLGLPHDCPAGAFIANYVPFHEGARLNDGREWRAVRTTRCTYARDLSGPWLLFDNLADPFQMTNLINQPAHAALQAQMDHLLHQLLQERGDAFLPADEYLKLWGYDMEKIDAVAALE